MIFESEAVRPAQSRRNVVATIGAGRFITIPLLLRTMARPGDAGHHSTM